MEAGFNRLLMNCDQNNPAKKAASRSELVAHLAGKGDINQREVVALLRLCSTLNPATSTTVRHFLLQVARLLSRVHAQHRYPQEMLILRSLWDATFSNEYSAARRNGITTRQFFTGYMHALQLLGPLHDMQYLVEYEGEWRHEKTRLKLVTRTSLLGQRMFAHALQDTLMDDFSVKIEQRLLVFDARPVTTEAVKAIKASRRLVRALNTKLLGTNK